MATVAPLGTPLDPHMAHMPRGAPSRGGPKKGQNLSRLGELLNTQKNVHFFAPPGDPPGGPLGGPPRPPLNN